LPPKTTGCQARGAANIEHIGKPRNNADTVFGGNPEGRRLFSRIPVLLVAHLE